MTASPRRTGPVLAQDWVGQWMAAHDLEALCAPEPPAPDPCVAAKAARDAEELERKRRLEHAVSLGLPFRHAMRQLQGVVEPSRALELTELWRQKADYGSILVLSGARGCGKTQALAKCVLDGPPRPHPWLPAWPVEAACRFIEAPALAKVGLYNAEALAPLRAAAVLAIDDLGTEFLDQRGAFRSLLDSLLNHRYAGAGFTLISTNLPQRRGTGPSAVDGLAERYGERLLSRLEEPGCGLANLKEPSFRTQARKGKT